MSIRRLISLIIVFVVLSLFSICLALEIADVPQYPGSELRKNYIKDDILFTESWLKIEDVKSKNLADEGTHIAQKYLEMVQKDGWELIKEYWRGNGADFTLKKDITKLLKVDVGTAVKGSSKDAIGYVFIKLFNKLIPIVFHTVEAKIYELRIIRDRWYFHSSNFTINSIRPKGFKLTRKIFF